MPKEIDAPDGRATADDDDLLVVAVVRTGGIAGLRRRWRVEMPSPEAHDWLVLIERCPWNAPAEHDAGADRYVWSIQVRMPSEERERELADSELRGAWRDLVDAVRDADAARTTKPGDPASRE